MTDTEYRYLVIRHLPVPAREEFRNIGVVVRTREGDIVYKLDNAYLGEHNIGCMVNELIDRTYSKNPRGGFRSTAVQLSEERPVWHESAASAANWLYDWMVSR